MKLKVTAIPIVPQGVIMINPNDYRELQRQFGKELFEVHVTGSETEHDDADLPSTSEVLREEQANLSL